VSTDGWVVPDTPEEPVPGPAATALPPVTRAAAPSPAIPVPVPLKPLRLLDVLDGAFAVVKLRPGTVIGVTAVLVLPIQVLGAWLARGDLGSVFETGANASLAGALDGAGTGTGWVDVLLIYVALLPLPFVGAFVARLLAAWYGGEDPSTGEVLRAVGPRVPALLGSWVLIHLLETPAALACGIPVLFVFPLVLLCAPTIAIEELGGIAGLRRGWQLGARRYWACFWVATCSMLVSFVLQLSLGLLPTILADVLGPDWGWVVLAVGNALAALIVTPFVAAAAALQYLDVRIRTEGLDLELRAVQILGRA
jgi:hypothetical protein